MQNRRRDKQIGQVGGWVAVRTFAVAAVMISSVGCADILGIETIESCWDATGFNGRGCYRTEGDCKLTKEQLPNACTDAEFVLFDNQVQLGLSAPEDLPKIPPTTTVTVPPDTGSSEPDTCPTTNRVIVAGSNAMSRVVSYISAAFHDAQTPITVLYQSLSSCHGAATIYKDVKVGGEFSYWIDEGKPELTKVPCTMPDQVVDIGVSDVFGDTCGFPDDSNIALDALGPIQAMIFVAPKSSTQRAISAEAARLVYGYGGTYQKKYVASPWNNPDHIHCRIPTSGTQRLIGASIGVLSGEFAGVKNQGTQDMITSLQMTATENATSTIGILDVVNLNLMGVGPTLRPFAFQAEGQNCAFFPDSTSTSSDKRNVRDGHYTLWGPLHIYRRPGANDNIANVVKYLSLDPSLVGFGKTVEDTMKSLISTVADVPLVPSCAMRVRRTTEGGALLPHIPTQSCSCFFDELTSETTCATCKTYLDCVSPDAPACNFGFCEPQ